MSFPVMPFMKKVALPPIMSFQTDKNGTFDPSMTIASGTLKWVIDGEEIISNSPSKALTGAIVNVQVFANTVPINAISTNTNFDSQDIIGELDFSHFTLTITIRARLNVEMTSVLFSSNNNTCFDFIFNGCNLSSIDLSNVLIEGSCILATNQNLSNVAFSTGANESASFQLQDCNLSSLDLSNIKLTGIVNIFNNVNLPSIAFSNDNTGSLLRVENCNLSSLDLSDFTTLSFIRFQDNSIVTYTPPSTYSTGMSSYRASGNALNLTSVDALYSSLNTFMSANAPTANLLVETNGGTNASPTGGAANTDIVNLDTVVYPATAFDFTFTIN